MEDESIQIQERIVGEPPAVQEQPDAKIEAFDPYQDIELQEVAQGAESLETSAVEEKAPEVEAKVETKDDDVDEELPRSVQKRINKMNRERREAEERAHRAEMQLAQAYQPQLLQQQQQRDPYAPVEPDENDPKYATNVKAYIKDAVEYQKRLFAYEAQKSNAQRYQAEREQKYVQQANLAREKYDDFEEAIEGLAKYPAITSHPNLNTALEAIKELNNGADVAYHLAKNANDLMAILNKSPVAMIAELGRVSGKVEANETKPAVTKSNAPPPPTKVSGIAPPPSKKHFADLSIDEMEAKFRSLP